MTANHHFTKPAEVQHDELFEQTRKYNGLTVNIPVHASHVVTVSDDQDQFDDAVYAAGADLLGGQYGYVRQGFVRRALRPASSAQGRGRWR